MSIEIVKINASDYGLEESKAKEIESLFVPMLSKMKELEVHYNDILKLPINPETCQMAKDLRLSYVKVRTGTAEIHKNLKAFYLNGGRFVDGWKNAQLFASQQIEETLKNIENHYEILEAQEKEKLKEKRTKMIFPYMEEVNTFSLGEMTEEVWQRFFTGAKFEYETRIAAEKKAEDDRIAKEKAEAEAREKQRLENIRLQKEAEAREKEIAAEREKVRKENERKEAELAKEREQAEKERKALEEKARKEAEEREKLQAEIQARKEAEEKAKDDEIKRIASEEKKAKLAPDKDKLLNFMQVINDLTRPEVKSIEAAEIVSNVNTLLVKVSNYILENANKL